MPDFLDSLSDHGRAQWYQLLQELGIAYKAKDKQRTVSVSAKLEDIEEIGKLMAQAPRRSKDE